MLRVSSPIKRERISGGVPCMSRVPCIAAKPDTARPATNRMGIEAANQVESENRNTMTRKPAAPAPYTGRYQAGRTNVARASEPRNAPSPSVAIMNPTRTGSRPRTSSPMTGAIEM